MSCEQVKSRVELWSLFGFFNEGAKGNGNWRTSGRVVGESRAETLR